MKKVFILLLILFCCAAFLTAEEKVLTIPYSNQSKAYSCGQNSFRMVMGYWGTDLSKSQIFGYTGYNATNSKLLKGIVGKYFPYFTFKQISKSIDSVIAAIDDNKPVLVEVNAGYLTYLDYSASAGHYIVAVGYNTEKKVVYVRDPNSYYVEELPFADLEKAWSDKKHIVFTIYRKNGKFVPAKKIRHYSDKAKPFGAEKEKRTTPLYAFLIPSVYTVFNTSENGIKNTTLQDDWLYTIKIQGVSFGHLVLDRSPWIFQEVPYYGFSGNLGYNFGRNKVLFSNSEAVSPGVFRMLQNRTLDVRTFNSIKPIPALTLRAFVAEVSGFAGLQEVNSPYDSLELSRLLGGRICMRYGLNQALGYISGAGSVVSLILSSGDRNERIIVPGGDLTLGPLEGAFQYYDKKLDSGTEVKVLAYSGALNLNMPELSGGFFTYLNYAGLFKLFYQFSHEEFLYSAPALNVNSLVNTHRIEVPMNLKYLYLIYGADFVHGGKGESLDSFSTGARLLFNLFLPYFQLQAGYTYTWHSGGGISRDIHNHALNLGFYAGLW